MKTYRFSVFTRAAAVLLAGLLAAGGPAGSRGVSVRIGKLTISYGGDSKKLAQALAQQTGEVKRRFDESRRALHTVKGPRGEPAYARQDVAGLVAGTATDLDQAIARVGDPRLEGLRAWSAEELRPIQEELAAPARHAEVLPAGNSFAPRAVAVVASLGWLPLPEPEGGKAPPPKKPAPKKAAPRKEAPKQTAPKPAAPEPETITAEKTNGFLDQVGEVVSRIFFLASHEDLEVKLWVGSTPAPRVKFSFWPQGSFKGSAPEPMIIQTNGGRDHVLRGLYSYNAAWKKGAVTQVIRYPSPAGAPAAQVGSERLDLVKGSGFFCCQFGDNYCHHVDDPKECR
ncbi:MAG TPA: hypothetical protein VIC28_02445 [Thermoanaerobaculia bacterium]